MAEAELYAAVLDTLARKRAELWDRPRPDTVTVLSVLYWWPMIQLDGARGQALGPTPIALPEAGRRRGYEFLVVDSIAGPQPHTKRVGGPVIALGPVDYLGEDLALVRTCVPTGPNGQELYRVVVRRTNGMWHAVALAIELQS